MPIIYLCQFVGLTFCLFGSEEKCLNLSRKLSFTSTVDYMTTPRGASDNKKQNYKQLLLSLVIWLIAAVFVAVLIAVVFAIVYSKVWKQPSEGNNVFVNSFLSLNNITSLHVHHQTAISCRII